jgi:hypothetical protein
LARSPRELTKRAVDPLLTALDRRLESLAARLEGHTSRLADAQRADLNRIDDRLAVELRVIDEHLLATQRASGDRAGQRDALTHHLAALVDGALDAGRPLTIVVAPPGTTVAHEARPEEVARFIRRDDGTWVHTSDGGDDAATLRVAHRREPR